MPTPAQKFRSESFTETDGFGDGNAMFSFRVFLVVAVLDLATATLTLMRGWNVENFWNSFRSYSVTDVWDLWVVACIRILLLILLFSFVWNCSWQRSSKNKANKHHGKSEGSDTLAYIATIANMSLLSILVVFIIGKIAYILCFSELVTDGPLWHWLMVGQSTVTSFLEYFVANFVIKAIEEENDLKRRHENLVSTSSGDAIKYRPLKGSDYGDNNCIDGSHEMDESDNPKDDPEASPDSMKQESSLLNKLEELRAKRKIIWRLIQMAALDWIWLLLGLIFLLFAAFTQVDTAKIK